MSWATSRAAGVLQAARSIAPLRRARPAIALGLVLGALASGSAHAADGTAQRHPDVLAVDVTARSATVFDFDVTVSSPYDTPQRYADAFRVTGKDGEVFGERRLLHDHQHEQPFTRDLYGVSIPAGVRVVQVQARDRKYGYGGKRVTVELPGR